MFIPFLASITAGAIATALLQLGAMSVWVSVVHPGLHRRSQGRRSAAGGDVLGMSWGCG
jgi:hypothetical protein